MFPQSWFICTWYILNIRQMLIIVCISCHGYMIAKDKDSIHHVQFMSGNCTNFQFPFPRFWEEVRVSLLNLQCQWRKACLNEKYQSICVSYHLYQWVRWKFYSSGIHWCWKMIESGTRLWRMSFIATPHPFFITDRKQFMAMNYLWMLHLQWIFLIFICLSSPFLLNLHPEEFKH